MAEFLAILFLPLCFCFVVELFGLTGARIGGSAKLFKYINFSLSSFSRAAHSAQTFSQKNQTHSNANQLPVTARCVQQLHCAGKSKPNDNNNNNKKKNKIVNERKAQFWMADAVAVAVAAVGITSTKIAKCQQQTRSTGVFHASSFCHSFHFKWMRHSAR